MSFGTQTITNLIEPRRTATVKQVDENPRIKEELHAETTIRAPDDLELEVRPGWSLPTARLWSIPAELDGVAESIRSDGKVVLNQEQARDVAVESSSDGLVRAQQHQKIEGDGPPLNIAESLHERANRLGEVFPASAGTTSSIPRSGGAADCSFAVSGHVAAALPRSEMKSRFRIRASIGVVSPSRAPGA